MSIITSSIRNSNGTTYTITTDSPSDWTSVAINTYFKNLSDGLIYYKTSTSNIVNTISSSYAISASFAPPPSGPFGITNTSGSYTYYTTFSASMAAATSGQTVEMFADVTETTNTTITLKNGVTINGNGHTYTFTTGSSQAFKIADSVSTTATILDLNITCTGTSTNLYLGTNTSGTIILTGCIFKNTSSGICLSNFANADVEVIDFKGFSNTGRCIQWGSSPTGGRLRNSYAYSASEIAFIGIVSRVENCIFASGTSIGLYLQGGTASDSIGVSAGSYGIQTIGGVLNNCKGYSSANVGLYALYSNIYGCFGYSTAGAGINMDNDPTNAYNCLGYSTTSFGILSNSTNAAALKNLYNCTAIADANIAMQLTAGTENNAMNCVAISKWNNAGGHGIRVTGANNKIINCSIEVTNASANCINAASALTAKYANNAFKGATTSINANVTQGMINTQDNFGNITI